MSLGKNGHTVGSDFVSYVTVRCNPVCSDDNGLNPAFGHHHACHIITEQRNVNAGLLKLKCSQSCTLKYRTSLVCKYFQMDTAFLCEIHWSGCRTVFRCSQSACITVSEHTHTILEQR
ncbi:hypothetical protein D3C74_376630 [compost metagenome]